MIGTRLGHYRIDEWIGAGGMGEVYRAHDGRLQRDAAIKVLPSSSVGDPGARARLLREARAAAALNHPHICTIHEIGESNGQMFIAMELIDGKPLDQLVPSGGLSPDLVVDYAMQIADAVGYAHERGIVHRDLKAANIMVTRNARVKVLDFGLAKRSVAASLDATIEGPNPSSLTVPGMIVGTPAYLAPEQLRGQPADTRSDVWSLGVVLYEMLSGRRPFSGQTPFDLSSAILNGVPPPLPSSVSNDLREVVDRCLSRNPELRYADAIGLRVRLDEIRRGDRVGLRQHHAGRAARALPRAAKILCGVIVAAATVWGLSERPDRLFPGFGASIDSVAVLPFQNLSGDPAKSYLADGVQEAVIAELATLPQLRRVIERRSTTRFRESDKGVAEIARMLGVRAVVTGAVLWAGDRLRVTARLVEASSERPLWSRTYEGDLREAVQLQRQIVKDLASSMKVRLGSAETQRLARSETVDPATYEAYLRGMFLLHDGTVEDRVKGLTFLQEAVNRDPGNAHAYAGLAVGYVTIGHSPAATADSWTRARAAAERALKLDPNLADAHAALADMKLYYEWDWSGAEREFLRANELNSNLAMNHYHYAWYLALFDRLDEAIVEHKRAQELDPLTPLHTGWLGELYAYAGRYEEGLSEARKSREMDPNFAVSWLVEGAIQRRQGHYNEAIAAHQKAAALNPNLNYALGVSYAKAGQLERARHIVDELQKGPLTPFAAWGLLALNTQLGNLDEAFKWANYEPHHAFIPWLRIMPEFEPLRKDPRFSVWLARLNLPPRKI